MLDYTQLHAPPDPLAPDVASQVTTCLPAHLPAYAASMERGA